MVPAPPPPGRLLDPATDFARLRAFLAARARDTPPGRAWDVRMWDGAWFTGAGPEEDARRRARMRIFEDAAGDVVAALLSFGDEEIHPQSRPDHAHLEEQLLVRGEALLEAAGERTAKILCWERDAARGERLARRGWSRTQESANLYRMQLAGRGAPDPRLPAGYVLRTSRPEASDRERVAALLNAGFGRTRHTANEVRAFQEHAPSFRRDLDLLAEAPDGTLAAYAAVCWDDANARGIYEPVCTHTAHRRRGLARALMLEGLRRALAAGARSLEVPTGDAGPANALYRAIGFQERHRGWFWTKTLGSGSGRVGAHGIRRVP